MDEIPSHNDGKPKQGWLAEAAAKRVRKLKQQAGFLPELKLTQQVKEVLNRWETTEKIPRILTDGAQRSLPYFDYTTNDFTKQPNTDELSELVSAARQDNMGVEMHVGTGEIAIQPYSDIVRARNPLLVVAIDTGYKPAFPDEMAAPPGNLNSLVVHLYMDLVDIPDDVLFDRITVIAPNPGLQKHFTDTAKLLTPEGIVRYYISQTDYYPEGERDLIYQNAQTTLPSENFSVSRDSVSFQQFHDMYAVGEPINAPHMLEIDKPVLFVEAIRH